MHEIIHRWSDGYGTELTFTLVANSSGVTGTDYAFLNFTEIDNGGDTTVDLHDLIALAAAALAMAEAINNNRGDDDGH